jgi:low temperature requirement protein LtrA
MTGSRASKVLRKPEQPPRATFKELFFDLVFVFGFTRITARLMSDVTVYRRTSLTQVGETLLVLLALLMVWFITAWVTDLYDPDRPEVQLVVAGAMFGGR